MLQLAKKKAPANKPKGYGKLSQKEKFIAAAKAHGADETGETFLASFKAIAKPKRGLSMSNDAQKPVGWIVRVTIPDAIGGRPLKMLYAAGFFTSGEAEKAVQEARNQPNETYDAVDMIREKDRVKPRAGEVFELSSGGS